MKYVNLGNTDIKISQLCMGTVNYGTKVPEEVAFRQLDRFLEAGGNFLDTARVYGDGVSEETIGKWFVQSGKRDQVVLCTKGGHPVMGDWANSRCTVENLTYDLAESLKALQTDYIDLYLMHRDKRDVPVEELIDWMEEQKAAGKIRYYGCSNWDLARIQAAQAYAASKGYDGFVASEQMYSLADVNAENVAGADMHVLDAQDRQYHEETGMAMMAYMSIANGYLMKAVRGEEIGPWQHRIYDNEVNETLISQIKELLAENPEYTVEDICYHFIFALPCHAVALAAFSNDVQMETALAACEKDVSVEWMEKLFKEKKN